MTRGEDGSIPSGSCFSLCFCFFSLFHSCPPLCPHPQPSPPALRRSRSGTRSAAEEKNGNNEIKRKVCRFAGGVIRKASGWGVAGGGGLCSRVQSEHLAQVSGRFFFLFFFKSAAVCFVTGEQEGRTARCLRGCAEILKLILACRSFFFKTCHSMMSFCFKGF